MKDLELLAAKESLASSHRTCFKRRPRLQVDSQMDEGAAVSACTVFGKIAQARLNSSFHSRR